MVEAGKITVLLVEDHHVCRMGIKLLLEQAADIVVLGEATNGEEAVSMAGQMSPDIILMDLGLPGMDGLKATQLIREQASPQSRIVMLTSHTSEDDVFAALSAGAQGYCTKDTDGARLRAAIDVVHNGGVWLDPLVASRVLKALPEMSKMATAPAGNVKGRLSHNSEELSEREIEVLKLVVEGLSNAEIAERLILSPETIKSHLRRIMGKLAVSDRTQAAVKALRSGIV